MDMYSLYQFSYKSLCEDKPKNFPSFKTENLEIENIEKNISFLNYPKFNKILTLENTPNKFLSNFYIDRFFIINGDSVKLFDNNFLMINNKNFNPQNNTIYSNSTYDNFKNINSHNSQGNQRIDNDKFNNLKYFNLVKNKTSNFFPTEKTKLNLNNNFKSYEKGTFINNPNIIMLHNKETISLCDFRVYFFNY